MKTVLWIIAICEVIRVAPTVDEAAEQGKPKWCPLFEINDWRDA